ncbi:hypothetical protein D6C79_09126 [Aureobasidium pullulans]|nr:hypothetical protein D6C79_09126 [Aureobasidium pullulans]
MSSYKRASSVRSVRTTIMQAGHKARSQQSSLRSGRHPSSTTPSMQPPVALFNSALRANGLWQGLSIPSTT